jgi:putative dimethyl sulfoxide reductase chaperone
MMASSEHALARPAIYQGLVRGLAYPSEEFMAQAQAWQANLAQALEAVGAPVVQAAQALPTLNGDLQALQVEHTRLFINGVPRVLAPPYASVYEDDGQLMGRPAARALRAYQAAGLTLSAAAHALPDHLAIELEFMFYLGRRALDAADDGGALQRSAEFLNECLRPWVALWRRRVEESARLAFYPALARVIEAWLETDTQHLANMIRVEV